MKHGRTPDLNITTGQNCHMRDGNVDCRGVIANGFLCLGPALAAPHVGEVNHLFTQQIGDLSASSRNPRPSPVDHDITAVRWCNFLSRKTRTVDNEAN